MGVVLPVGFGTPQFGRVLSRIAFVVTILGGVLPCASAQPSVRMSLDGKTAEFKDSTFPTSLKRVVFYAQSDADFTQPLVVSIKAPAGAVVSVEAVRTKARTPSSVSRKAFYPIPMKKRGASALTESIRLKASSSSRALTSSQSRMQTATSSEGGCCGLNKQSLDFLLAFYRATNPACDYTCVCDDLAKSGTCSLNPDTGLGSGSPGGGGPTDVPDFPNTAAGDDEKYYATALLDGAFMKDACAQSAIPSLLRVSVDLSKVKRSRFKNGVTVNAAALERTYTGSRAASIKPVSDGKYAPRPLLIMARAAPGREAVRVVRWKQGKPRIERTYNDLDSASYRGLSLMRVPVDLPGGWASVDLLDDESFTQGYGVCLEMIRRRQRVNGYPSSPRDG